MRIEVITFQSFARILAIEFESDMVVEKSVDTKEGSSDKILASENSKCDDFKETYDSHSDMSERCGLPGRQSDSDYSKTVSSASGDHPEQPSCSHVGTETSNRKPAWSAVLDPTTGETLAVIKQIVIS